MNARPVLVVGVGNDSRGDDAAGLILVRRLRAASAPGVIVAEAPPDGAALMDLWKDARTVMVLDAVQSGAPPGTVHRMDAAQPVPASFFRCSTHAFGVAEAVELARALGTLPPCLILLGIEGSRFGHGEPLSGPVASALDEAERRLRAEISVLCIPAGG